MSKECLNYSRRLGCQRAFGGTICPWADVERVWSGEPGSSDSIPKRVICKLTDRELKQNVNFQVFPLSEKFPLKIRR